MKDVFSGTTEEAGRRVRARRREMGLNQAELGKLAGTSRKFVSDFELGHPRAEFGKAIELMKAAGISLTLLETTRPPVTFNVNLKNHIKKVTVYPSLSNVPKSAQAERDQ